MHTLYVIEKGRNYISLSGDIETIKDCLVFGLLTPENQLKTKVVCLTLKFAFHVHD
jgi:hypothetical protein